MRKFFLKYILIGLGFASVIEIINMGILQNNWSGMVTTLLVVYTIFISVGYLFQRRFGDTPRRLLLIYIVMGLLGLVGIEWILIGTPPNLSQSWLTIGIFQLGIFNYWATVGIGPRLFLDELDAVKPILVNFLRFYLIWYSLVYIIGLGFLTGNDRFVFMQVFSSIGSIIMIRYFIRYYLAISAIHHHPHSDEAGIE